jgi:hypothetical protein
VLVRINKETLKGKHGETKQYVYTIDIPCTRAWRSCVPIRYRRTTNKNRLRPVQYGQDKYGYNPARHPAVAKMGRTIGRDRDSILPE